MPPPAAIAPSATSTRMSTSPPVTGSAPRTLEGTLTPGMLTPGMLTLGTETGLTSSPGRLAPTGDTEIGGDTGTEGVSGIGGLDTHPVWAGLVCPMPLLVSHS